MDTAEVEALRYSAALSEMTHVAALRVGGDDAYDALDVLIPADLFISDGQMLHSLMLDPGGEPLADLYLCCDDEEFILLVEGMTAPEIVDHAREHLSEGLDLTFEDLGETHEVLSINGPYAWEVLSEWIGPDIIGIPFFSFFHLDASGLLDGAAGRDVIGTCFRAGKTGEFGYDLLLRRDRAGEVKDLLFEKGAALGLGRASLATLDLCALENGFFSIRGGPWRGLTPRELQLQCRLSYAKDSVGMEALRQRRSQGLERRQTTFVAPGSLERDDPVFSGDDQVGIILATMRSVVRGDWVGLALLDRRLAHAGIHGLEVRREGERLPLRTVSPPVINNRSLYVDPRRHSARYREDEEFPPLFNDESGHDQEER